MIIPEKGWKGRYGQESSSLFNHSARGSQANSDRILRKTTTLEIIESSEPWRPRIKRDRRGGLPKLNRMIYFLRDHGYAEGHEIPYDDVEWAIIEISQGLDPRTIKKYHDQLLKFHYLEPKGPPLHKIRRVTVTTYNQVDSSPQHNPKEYRSQKGYRSYVFGVMAPRRYSEPSLKEFPERSAHPPQTPPSKINEEIALQESARITSEKCVCESRGAPEGNRGASEEAVRNREERENTVSHTYRLGESIPEPQKEQPGLTAEELRILSSSKGREPLDEI